MSHGLGLWNYVVVVRVLRIPADSNCGRGCGCESCSPSDGDCGPTCGSAPSSAPRTTHLFRRRLQLRHVRAARGTSCGACGDDCGSCCQSNFCIHPFRWIGNLFYAGTWCGPRCGNTYWGEGISDPPDCHDPCNRNGQWTGRSGWPVATTADTRLADTRVADTKRRPFARSGGRDAPG